MDVKLIKARRKAIEDDARCVGCGATRAYCNSHQGEDPTAPSWFGCCAPGTALSPCHHVADQAALRSLLDEIESGEVRSEEEVLLDSIREFPRPRRWLPPGMCMIDDCGCSGEEHA